MSNIRALTDDLQSIAIAELNEVPERVPADIAAFREWIDSQPHLNARTDDQFLLGFLRGCKFSLEMAKLKIDMYFTMKTREPDFCTIRNIDESRLLELIRLGCILPLPKPLNGNGPRIWWLRAGALPVDRFSLSEIICLGCYLLEMAMVEDDYSTINGRFQLMDLAGMTGAHLMQLTPSLLMKGSKYLDESLLSHELSMHCINIPPVFESAFRIVKTVLPTRQLELLRLHDDGLESLYKFLPQKYLPVELGGENGCLAEMIDDMEKRFVAYRARYPNDLDYGVDESLRAGKSIKCDNVFGTEGSFRKINVD